MLLESQKHLLEKAQLMALFAELDPNPLIRINSKGEIIHTNESSRSLFPQIDLSGSTIEQILPSLKKLLNENVSNYIENIGGKIFSLEIKHVTEMDFANIYFHDITNMKRYEYELESYKKNLLALSNELEEKLAELQKKLSAELHDDIGQQLIILRLKISNAEKYKRAEILSDIEAVYQRIRGISKSLTPIEVGTLGLKLSLQSIIKNVSKVSGIKGRLNFGPDVDADNDAETDNFIIHFVQESLNNVMKHSQASKFLVAVSKDEKNITVAVSDNGTGISEDGALDNVHLKKTSGLGLLRLRERINRFGGSISIESDSKYKTNLIARIPFERGADETN